GLAAGVPRIVVASRAWPGRSVPRLATAVPGRLLGVPRRRACGRATIARRLWPGPSRTPTARRRLLAGVRGRTAVRRLWRPRRGTAVQLRRSVREGRAGDHGLVAGTGSARSRRTVSGAHRHGAV